jgi:predicted TIM-barrel fold metal-dependent hydrolase
VLIDELGFAPLDDTGTQLLFRFVAAAYERRSLVIGSHWPFESWGKFLPEHTTAVSLLDAYGVAQGLLPVTPDDVVATRAIRWHLDRLIGSYLVDPLRRMDGVRELETVVRELGVKAAAFFPWGCVPQEPIDDRMAYPLYAKCVELDIPIFINTGVPGPRVPMDAQEVRLLDKVCWFFPELRIVMWNGGELWVDLAVS